MSHGWKVPGKISMMHPRLFCLLRFCLTAIMMHVNCDYAHNNKSLHAYRMLRCHGVHNIFFSLHCLSFNTYGIKVIQSTYTTKHHWMLDNALAIIPLICNFFFFYIYFHSPTYFWTQRCAHSHPVAEQHFWWCCCCCCCFFLVSRNAKSRLAQYMEVNIEKKSQRN